VAEKTGAERREYVRVNSSLRFTMERLESELDVEEAIAEIMSEPAESPLDEVSVEENSAEARIIESLKQIMEVVEDTARKVDILLAAAEGRPMPKRETIRLPLHNLSGGGFSFYHRDALRLGDLYRISVELSRMPPAFANFVAEIKWAIKIEDRDVFKADGAPEAYEVGMEVRHIRESERERIIRTVFRIQREELRARRESQGIAAT